MLKLKLEKGSNPGYWIKKIERNMERDSENDKALLFLGWTVIRFWGSEIERNIEECVKVIEESIFDNMIADEDFEIQEK